MCSINLIGIYYSYENFGLIQETQKITEGSQKALTLKFTLEIWILLYIIVKVNKNFRNKHHQKHNVATIILDRKNLVWHSNNFLLP